jgi:hypothetical protein
MCRLSSVSIEKTKKGGGRLIGDPNIVVLVHPRSDHECLRGLPFQFKSVVISVLATVSSILIATRCPADWRLGKLAEPYEHEHSDE